MGEGKNIYPCRNLLIFLFIGTFYVPAAIVRLFGIACQVSRFYVAPKFQERVLPVAVDHEFLLFTFCEVRMRRMLPLKTAVLLAFVLSFGIGIPAAPAQAGREFWIAIPPNEHDNGYPTLALEIYVTSQVDTRVTLEYPGSGYTTTREVKAGITTTFTTADGSANWSWEVREDERPGNQGILIRADDPVSISVLNSKPVSSDGYTAIPVDAWGTEYIHLGFYDFGEFSPTPWGGGFVLVAQENNTQVTFTLKGVDHGNPAARTKRDRTLGTTYSVKLQRGQTYMVRGNGQTLNEFDISGTRVVANKPIGFFSFHQRTMIPSFPSPNNGRNHLVEMLPPVSTWGTEHVSLELNRAGSRGDFFRIIAQNDNTHFQCRYTDLKDGSTYTWEGTLEKAGDFMEKENTWPPSASIRGVAVWTSDKPTLVMQYAYSAAWDNASQWDPFMVQAVPTNAYVQSSVFSAPSNIEFTDNFLNLIAVGDTTDPEQTKLRTIAVDGQPVWVSQPSFIVNRIQQTPYYWARLKLAPGAHTITGDTEFGAILHGVSSFSGYGWPVAASPAATPTSVSERETGPGLALAAEAGSFAETMRMRYTLPAAGAIQLELYTTAGERVRVLEQGYKEAGTHVYELATDNLASGMYLCRLVQAGEIAARQICIVK